MNFEHYRIVFVASSLTLMLIATAPTLGLIVQFPNNGEGFSEFWILGPHRMAEDYPFTVRVNESYNVFVGVGNHMGVSSYYLVYVKFRNQTQLLPNATTSQPSPLTPLYEFRTFIRNGENWEAPLTFGVSEISRNNSSVEVSRININGIAIPINAFATWKNNGFYFQLFFELWLFDHTEQSFQFHNRFVGIWLNVTT